MILSPTSSLPSLLLPQSAPKGDTLAETVNHLLDAVIETCGRLLELPLLVLLGSCAGLALLAAWWLRRRASHQKPVRALRWALFGTIAALGVVMLDRKIAYLQQAVTTLRMQTRSSIAAMLEVAGRTAATRSTLLFDRETARQRLQKTFGNADAVPSIVDAATDIVQLHIAEPPIEALLAIVDLRCAGLTIEIGSSLGEKVLTSTFAAQRGCSIAINGEAGNSGRPGCGLGRWQGFLVQRGQVLLRELEGNARPFLCFDAQNRASFRAGSAQARELPANAHNAIWGRVDALVAGVVSTEDFRLRQPRTAMAIDPAGEHLYLLVVDGRQERSRGMTRAEVGNTLQAFGASDGMLCDEGGSSCMYLKLFGGIANVPSDRAGEERPTYTHFGVVVPGR